MLKSFYESCMKVILNSNINDEFILIGDFNVPDADWFAASDDLNVKSSHLASPKSTLLKDFVASCSLSQYNFVPNLNNRYLDLVFSTSPIIKVIKTDPLTKLDNHHPALLINYYTPSFQQTIPKADASRFNFYKCNYSNLKYDLKNLNWTNILTSDAIDSDVELFYIKLNHLIKKHTPVTKIYSHKYPLWFSYSLKKCIKEKLKFHKLYKKYRNPRDYDTFDLLRKRSKKLMIECYNNYITSVEQSVVLNVKHFWRYVNSRKNSKNNMPATMKYGTQIASNPSDVSELFSNYFGSVFEKGHARSYSPTPSTSCGYSICRVSINEDLVLSKIKMLDVAKGAGPDAIPPLLIKRCGKELALPLSILFNKSINSGIFPSVWKTAHVIPVFKSGDKSLCNNYRPISILSCFGKLFESIVYDVLYSHLIPFISTCQHGFIKNRSTTSNLLEYKHFICSSFAKCTQVDSVYTDFAKAFDKVNHVILCKKIEALGVHGCLLRWIKSYLCRRSQLVALKGVTSLPILVTSGVPQGSHLGPLFFNVYINDLIECLACPCVLYADDMKVYNNISSVSDALKLQNDLDVIANWCNSNEMSLNIDKCVIISFTNKANKIDFNYSLNNVSLKRVTSVKDLGIIFDDRLTFREHYDYIVGKSSRLLGFISRSTLNFKNPTSFIHLYCSLVRSILEYNSCIWSPHYIIHKDRIEHVQKRALHIITYRFNLIRKHKAYNDRLLTFKIGSLEDRRFCADFVTLHKIIHSYIDSPNLLSNINFNTYVRCRNPSVFTLQVYRCNTSFYNPIIRMCRQYNDLVKSNASIDIFNSNLYIFQKNIKNLILFSLKN